MPIENGFSEIRGVFSGHLYFAAVAVVVVVVVVQ